MALAPEDLRFAVQDARERHKATVETIAGMDRQALAFLQLYVTLAGAALSGAGVILLSDHPSYSASLGIGLLGFAAPLVIGALLSMLTIWPDDINLPGRDPNFWIWANSDRIEPKAAYIAYLEQLAVKARQNMALNQRMSKQMLAAKIAGVAAPIIGIVAAVIHLRFF